MQLAYGWILPISLQIRQLPSNVVEQSKYGCCITFITTPRVIGIYNEMHITCETPRRLPRPFVYQSHLMDCLYYRTPRNVVEQA